LGVPSGILENTVGVYRQARFSSIVKSQLGTIVGIVLSLVKTPSEANRRLNSGARLSLLSRDRALQDVDCLIAWKDRISDLELTR